MKEEKYQDRIIDFLYGNLTVKEVEELRKMLVENGYDLSQLNQMENMVRQMDEIKVPEPREEMRDQFYRMLDDEKIRLASKHRFADSLLKPFRFLMNPAFLPRMSYASLILLLGIVLGHWIIPYKQFHSQTSLMVEEMQSMKKLIALTLFEQSNASDRLKAVNYTSELSQPDDMVLEALLKTLNNDPSVNVRLASLDALIGQIENSKVRAGLVQSISNQDSPLIQIAIAELMIKIQEKNSVPEIEKLLQKEDLNKSVEEKLKESIKILT